MSESDRTELRLTATIRLSGRFVPEAIAWPAGHTPEQMAAGTAEVYRADPSALLDAFPIESLEIDCQVAAEGETAAESL